MMLTVDEYMALRRLIDSERESEGATEANRKEPVVKPVRRRTSSYNRKYKAAFKRIAPTYKKASGQWKKGGFGKAVRAAHKAVKK